MPRVKFTAARAAVLSRDLLESPGCARRAQQAAARIGAEDGAGAAAEIIANMIDEK